MRGKRVLGLAELILDTEIYNINISEPQTENKYDDEIDENILNNDEDAVVIIYENKSYKCSIHKTDDTTGRRIKLRDCLIKDIQIAFEKKYNIIPIACMRMGYSGYGHVLKEDQTLGELGFGRGSKLYCFRGPYIFSGTSAETINWPLNRDRILLGICKYRCIRMWL